MNKRALGKSYENKAVDFLIKNGLKIIKTNYFTPYGEIDIIAVLNNQLIFFEVKYRSNNKYGSAIDSIDKNKAKHIYESANYFLSENEYLNYELRFDLIYFDSGKLIWNKDIIWGDDIGL